MSQASPDIPGLVHFVYISKCQLRALIIVWSFRNLKYSVNDKIIALCHKDVSEALYQTLQTTKMNFENCLIKKER